MKNMTNYFNLIIGMLIVLITVYGKMSPVYAIEQQQIIYNITKTVDPINIQQILELNSTGEKDLSKIIHIQEEELRKMVTKFHVTYAIIILCTLVAGFIIGVTFNEMNHILIPVNNHILQEVAQEVVTDIPDIIP